MKKHILLLGSAVVLALTSNAQEVASTSSNDPTISRKGEKVLPEAEDWSVGVDATPFLNYIGNLFNNTVNNAAPTWNYYTQQQNYTAIGKYFVDDKTAYRAVLAVNKESWVQKNEITKAEALPLPTQYFADQRHLVTDSWKHTQGTSFVLGAGYELRKGKGRLQGFYGGEVLFSLEGKSHDRYTYGNPLTQNPTQDQPNVDPGDATYTTNWGSNTGNGTDLLTHNVAVESFRVLERTTGASFAIGARGFIGAEYFFMPKMSVGGEFGWGFAWQRAAKFKATYEAEGHASDGSEVAAILEETNKGLRRKDFDMNNDRAALNLNVTSVSRYLAPQARLRLNFHF